MPPIVNSAVENAGDFVALTDMQRLVYSKEIRFQALPIMKFLQFAVRKTELLVAPGRQVRFLKYNDLGRGGRIINESDDIPSKALSDSYIDVTVYEYGNSVWNHELLVRSSFDDVLASTSKLLGRDYAYVVDELLRDTVLGGTNVVYGGQRASLGAVTSSDILNLAAIKDAVEVLASNNAPKINNDYYACFLHPHQARGLRDDARWQNVQQYAFMGNQVSPPIIGEIGRIEDVRFIETTQMTATTGSAFDIYKAVVFGDDAYAFAESLPVELREATENKFGRRHGLAWYSIMGSKIFTDENIVRIETA